MAKIIIACSKKPLAAFIETELAGSSVDCRVAVDAAQLMTSIAEFKADVLLFDSEFPSAGESSALLEELRGSSPQIPMVGILEPFGETQDEVRQGFSPANILQLPFGGDDLREKLGQAGSLEIIKKTTAPEKKEEEKMDKPQTVSIEMFELTEIVEEGLPLDELPEIFEGKTSAVLSNTDSDESVATDQEFEESADELELDGFSDTLDDFESTFDESSDAAFDAVVEDDTEVVPEPESDIESKAGENPSELVAGDIDALLDDDDFTEIKMPENPDPVLAELKSAGLKPEGEVVVESKSETASLATPELEGGDTFGEDELSDIDDFSDEISVAADAVDPENLAAQTQSPEEPVENEDSGQPLISTESSKTLETSEYLELAENLTALAGSEETFAAESPEADIELPEDYLLDEETPVVSVKPVSRPLTSLSSEPEVCAEPVSPDFSRQIESMTQEWSKQLLQTTYASMDKMIKAIGDLAPTIVDQVAREVIPPLAEKVIKAEIARLEEKLESEEEREEDE